MSEDTGQTPEPEKEAAGGGGKFELNTTIQALWNGEIALFKAFWQYYFAVVLVLGVLAAILSPMASMFGLLQMVWAGFMIKPIWLAADKYEGPAHWTLVAKVAAVLIGIAVLTRLMGILF